MITSQISLYVSECVNWSSVMLSSISRLASTMPSYTLIIERGSFKFAVIFVPSLFESMEALSPNLSFKISLAYDSSLVYVPSSFLKGRVL